MTSLPKNDTYTSPKFKKKKLEAIDIEMYSNTSKNITKGKISFDSNSGK